MEPEDSLKSKLIECLKQQLSEIEVLSSIYSGHIDIIFTDARIHEDIKDFVQNKTNFTPNHLDFTMNVSVDILNLEISINLPSFYPEEEPVICIRCNQLNRKQETTLNSELNNFIKNNHCGEQCLYTVISWLQENIHKFGMKSKEEPCISENVEKTLPGKFARYWIYSHHIYNKRKREDIIKIARDLSLTGFSFPGKPGIVCIEGIEDDCKEWWKIIKAMNWQKIGIKYTEIFELSRMNNERKFKSFDEIHFPNMSGFSKYLEGAGLLHVFNDLFGLCTSSTS